MRATARRCSCGVRAEPATALVAIARATGADHGPRRRRARLCGRRATAATRSRSRRRSGVARWPRDLAGAPRAARAAAARRAARDARRSPARARDAARRRSLLDRDGVRAYLPLAAIGAVLGDDGDRRRELDRLAGETVHRLGLPPRVPRARCAASPRPRRRGAGRAARSAAGERRSTQPRAIAKPDTGKHAVARASRSIRAEPARALRGRARARAPTTRRARGRSRASISRGARGAGSAATAAAPATPVAIAVARDVVVCAARGDARARRRCARRAATAQPRWEWEGDNVDAHRRRPATPCSSHDADRVVVLDARDRPACAAGSRATTARRCGRPSVARRRRRRSWSRTSAGALVARLPRGGHAAGVVARGRRRGPRARAVGRRRARRARGRRRATGSTRATGGGRRDAGPRARLARAGRLVTGHRGRSDPGAGAATRRRAAGRCPATAPIRRRTRRTADVDADRRHRRSATAGSSRSTSSTGGLRARNDYALVGADRAGARARSGRQPARRGVRGRGCARCSCSIRATGDPLRRVALPEDAPPGCVFGTIVDGTPVAGALLAVAAARRAVLTASAPRRRPGRCDDGALLYDRANGTPAPRCAAFRRSLHGQEPHHHAEHGAPRARHADRGAARRAALVHREHAAVEEGAAGRDDHAAPAGDRPRRDDRSDGHDGARGCVDPRRSDRGQRHRSSRSRCGCPT